MKKIALVFCLFISCSAVAIAQTGTIKMVSKKIEGPVEIAPGLILQSGDQLELHEGLAPDGFRHIYGIVGQKPTPLGYGANYETLVVDEIRHNKKYEQYYVLVKYNTLLFIAEVDKGLKSGEIKRIIPKE